MQNVSPTYIRTYEWTRFHDFQGFGSSTLVREFYSNYNSETPDEVYVRGKIIKIDAESLTTHCHVKPYNGSHIAEIEKKYPVESDRIALIEQKICLPKSVKWTKRHGQFVSFSVNFLKSKYKVWHKMITSNIMPTTATNDVTMERALLMLAVSMKLPVNLGQILNSQIYRCKYEPRACSFYFPKIITTLCYMNGVPVTEAERDQKQPKPITISSQARIPPGGKKMESESEDPEPPKKRAKASQKDSDSESPVPVPTRKRKNKPVKQDTSEDESEENVKRSSKTSKKAGSKKKKMESSSSTPVEEGYESDSTDVEILQVKKKSSSNRQGKTPVTYQSKKVEPRMTRSKRKRMPEPSSRSSEPEQVSSTPEESSDDEGKDDAASMPEAAQPEVSAEEVPQPQRPSSSESG